MTRLIGLRIVSTALLLCALTLMTQFAHAQDYTVLYSFTGTGSGEYPRDNWSLVIDSKGDVYGTTPYTTERRQGRGTVFRLYSTGQLSTLDRFSGNDPDGKEPVGGLTADKAGDLYGTTAAGGESGWGTIFELTPPKPGHSGWTETVLHSFWRGSDGAGPSQTLTMDGIGDLYGSTGYGEQGGGTVFKLSKSGVFTVLHYFSSGGAEGDGPGSLVLDPVGNIYGITGVGGINSCNGERGCGVVFKLTPKGQETVLYSFTGGTDGGVPFGLVLNVGQRALYGVTDLGGDLSCSLPLSQGGCGVIFRLDATGETVLHSFTGGSDGGFPTVVIGDGAGNLYGSTSAGGDLSCDPTLGYGCGVLFKLDTEGNYSVLYTFGPADFPSGTGGVAGLALDKDGDLYGVTAYGGDFSCSSSGCGTVFKLTHASR
jgi:uncharacterized repeat protein (TIGR03803 family)